MSRQRLLIIMGVAGCGKSHACSRLDPDRFYYVSYDDNKKNAHLDLLRQCPKDKIAVYDLNIKTSTFIRRNSDEFDIAVVGIGTDFIHTKHNLRRRGGKITKSIYKRWRVMQKRFASFAQYVARDGDELARYINQSITHDSWQSINHDQPISE